MARSIVLLSGGLDSTVNLTRAVQESEVMTVLYFDYGQKGARRELASVRRIVAKFGVKSRVISLPWLETITNSALVEVSQEIPDPPSFEVLDTPEADSFVSSWARATWVPNRLGLFLSIGASFAEAYDCEYIVLGLNNTRGQSSPDHAAPFYNALNEFLQHSTLTGPQVVSYTGHMSKTQIVAHGREIGAPLEMIWDCYRGDAKMCGRCESCLRLIRAMDDSGNQQWFNQLHVMREGRATG